MIALIIKGRGLKNETPVRINSQIPEKMTPRRYDDWSFYFS